MSLTQHLHQRGPIRTWWDRRSVGLVPHMLDLSDHVTRVVPLSRPGQEHAAAVGGIVGRRIEAMTEAAPPYAAIMAGGVRSDACYWPTHAQLSGERRPAALEYRPTPSGWEHLVPAADRGEWSAALRHVAEVETTSDNVQELCRAAAAVTALESAYRSGGPVVEVSAEAVEDAATIVTGLSSSSATAARLCGGQIRGHAAPVFAPHWADGDVLLGPGATGGYGLVDVKTVGNATLRNPERTAMWLWQLLSYAALDVDEDLWRVRAVGVWLPRQDALVVWPLTQLWQSIGAGEQERRELVSLLVDAYQRDAGAAGNG